MNAVIEKTVPSEVWEWLENLESYSNVQKENDSAESTKFKKCEESKESNDSSPSSDGELYDAFGNTYVLRVVPKDLNNADPSAQHIVFEPDINRIINKIERGIKKEAEIWNGTTFNSNRGDHVTTGSSHFRIFSFINADIVSMVREEIISPLRKKNDRYHIFFNSLRKSDPTAYRLCGYVPVQEKKEYDLNTVGNLIRETLKSREECKIELLLLMGCYSYHLAKVFQPFIENIICVHPRVPIEDKYCVRFSRFFYRKLAQQYTRDRTFNRVVKNAFYEALRVLMENADLEGHIPQHKGDRNLNGYIPQCIQDLQVSVVL